MSHSPTLRMSPARNRRPLVDTKSPKINGGLRVEVTLIGGQKLQFSVGARLSTEELVALVSSHYAVRDCHYFSLAYRDHNGNYQWLENESRLLDHDFARGVRVLPLHFLVKFFPQSVTELQDAQAVELFFQYARDQLAQGDLEVQRDIALKLTAYILHASHGDYLDKPTVDALLQKANLLPSRITNEKLPSTYCPKQVYDYYSQLRGISRGDAIFLFMKEIEKLPGYAVHLYEVKDRSQSPRLLGINRKGIVEFDQPDRRALSSKRSFVWKQLENLYLRERKFSIEVLDTKRVSVTRRTFGPSNISVYVWCAESQALCRSIWSMAIAQHQYYLDSKSSKSKEGFGENLDLVGELSRSCVSLSAVSSPSISRSGSHSSLQQTSNTDNSVSTESLQAAKMELVTALQQRLDTMQGKLDGKVEELRLLCVREGELTGEMPPDYPLKPGEILPVVRKRVGTSFAIDESLINRIIHKQEETVASLELEHEIQTKITTAGLKLANEQSKRGLRRQRKNSYQLSLQKLKEIERKLKVAKSRQLSTLSTSNCSTMPKMKKKPRPAVEGEVVQDDSCLSISSSSLTSREFKETSFMDSSMGSSVFTPCQTKPRANSTQRLSTHSDSSYNPILDDSRSSSPGRPVSGYIPSGVYTRSQYRTQHFPTLSTRGQSVPLETPLQEPAAFNRAVFNVPHQRQSIVSQSLDDLDASINQPIVATPPNPAHVQSAHLTPHQYHFHHHHQYNHHHIRRNKTEIPDRVGSLDRRRPGSGRYESRSLEHLNENPYTPMQVPHETHTSSYPVPNAPKYATQSPYTPMQPTLPPRDVVDSKQMPECHGPKRRSHSVVSSAPVYHVGQDPRLNTPMRAENSLAIPAHTLVRTASGRSYMETTFDNDQENIPPHRQCVDPHAMRTPQTSNEPLHYRQHADTPDVPYRIPVTDLPPLRATKSTMELPPLKPTKPESQHCQSSTKLGYTINAQITPLSSAKASNFAAMPIPDEPLVSLAEAARLKKEQQREDRQMHEGPAKPPRLYPESANGQDVTDSRMPAPSHSMHNMSTSSIGSSGSTNSMFHTANEGDSLNTTLTVESPSNHMVITSGTFQPSREVSKPFEMSDFYKYSTKFRRQNSGQVGHESGSSPSPPMYKHGAPLSPNVVAQHSSPAPQQKGVYQPLAPMTCQPLSTGSSDRSSNSSGPTSEIVGAWEYTPVHQAVPATVTNKRAATLV